MGKSKNITMAPYAVYAANPIIIKAEIFDAIRLNSPFWSREEAYAKVNIGAKVDRPKIVIISAPLTAEPDAAADEAKKYTRPHGKNPFKTPSFKNEILESERRRF